MTGSSYPCGRQTLLSDKSRGYTDAHPLQSNRCRRCRTSHRQETYQMPSAIKDRFGCHARRQMPSPNRLTPKQRPGRQRCFAPPNICYASIQKILLVFFPPRACGQNQKAINLVIYGLKNTAKNRHKKEQITESVSVPQGRLGPFICALVRREKW